jgi:hypothetical protein
MKVPNRKGIANQTVPESCVVYPEVRHEALTGGAYRPSPPDSPPKFTSKNLASLRVKHLGANESFDKNKCSLIFNHLSLLGDAELNTFFIY